MKMLAGTSHRKGIALLLSVLCGAAAAGCGVVYDPQEFAESSISYGYKGEFDMPIEVVPMTFGSARIANSDNYVPRSLPNLFAAADPITTVSTRERLAELGLDRIEPALVLDTPPLPALYALDREVLPPVVRQEGTAPVPVPDPVFDAEPDLSRLSALPDAAAYQPPRPRLPERETERPLFKSGADLDTRLERPHPRRLAANNPLPAINPGPYLIGPGDVLGLQLSTQSTSAGNTERRAGALANQRLLVQNDGQIFVPSVGTVSVGGMTLSEVRRVINDRLVASRLGFDPNVQIVEFGSKSISVSGLSAARQIPITVRPTTLSEAIVSVGGFGSNPANTIVRVLRGGSIYEMSGEQLLSSQQIARRVLLDGDIVSVTEGYDPDSTLAYFDQQMRLRALERTRFEDELARRAEARERRKEERDAARTETQDARAARQEARALEEAERERIRFDLEMKNYRLAADRLRREVEIERLQSRREADRFNEEARIANIEARQAYLDRLRTLEQLNRDTLRQMRTDTRETQIANRVERSRERAERRELLELELSEERARIDQLAEQRQQGRDLFNERVRLGAVQQDYVTIAGETNRQTTMALPFDGRLTLNRVLYEETNGINLVSGDTSEIYVIRTPREDTVFDRITAYHLDASNPAALAVASVFEMRPNDVVYVNPQPITKWNRVLTQILPSTGLLQSGISSVSGGL